MVTQRGRETPKSKNTSITVSRRCRAQLKRMSASSDTPMYLIVESLVFAGRKGGKKSADELAEEALNGK
jgi:hypothetical protein